MPTEPSGKDSLEGWKAIATYLKVGVRTAQEYEKQHHLPIRRYPGRGKSPVWAIIAELDEWQQQQQALSITASANTAEGASRPIEESEDEIFLHTDRSGRVDRRRWLTIAGLGALGVVGLGMVWNRLRLRLRDQPAAYTIEGSTLIVLTASRSVLFRHTFPNPILPPFVGVFHPGEPCVFGDVNGDGRMEVLFWYYPTTSRHAVLF